jgi:hypothetical protein
MRVAFEAAHNSLPRRPPHATIGTMCWLRKGKPL